MEKEPSHRSGVHTPVLALLFAVAQAPSHVETFTVDGIERQALVFPGTGEAPKEGRPLVLAFHGHGGNMRQVARSFGVQRLWPEATVIYPQGLPIKGLTDPAGTKPGWQHEPGTEGDRDLKFVDAILAAQKGIDPHRVYAMGHSNGGGFTYVLWAARGDRFAAYGPSSAGALPLARGLLKPASAFVTAGEADPLVPIANQRRVIDGLAKLDGVDLAAGTKQGYVTQATGPNGIELDTYVSPAGHTYPHDAVVATIEMFKRHRLP